MASPPNGQTLKRQGARRQHAGIPQQFLVSACSLSRSSDNYTALCLQSPDKTPSGNQLRWGHRRCMLESIFCLGIRVSMADHEARQTAEDHYYAALDLVSEGEHERAVA